MASSLVWKIRGEYAEMPGMSLTLAQASRLWQVDSLQCAIALTALVDEGTLTQTSDGAYVSNPATTQPRRLPRSASHPVTLPHRR